MRHHLDPDVYVVRHRGGYALYPFSADIVTRLRDGTMDGPSVLDAIRHLDVSLVLSADGSDVRWVHGDAISTSDLAAMAIV